jgi:hypothetical protein
MAQQPTGRRRVGSRYDNGISLALHNAAYRRSFFEVT